MVRNDAVVGFGEAEGNPAPLLPIFLSKKPRGREMMSGSCLYQTCATA